MLENISGLSYAPTSPSIGRKFFIINLTKHHEKPKNNIQKENRKIFVVKILNFEKKLNDKVTKIKKISKLTVCMQSEISCDVVAGLFQIKSLVTKF